MYMHNMYEPTVCGQGVLDCFIGFGPQGRDVQATAAGLAWPGQVRVGLSKCERGLFLFQDYMSLYCLGNSMAKEVHRYVFDICRTAFFGIFDRGDDSTQTFVGAIS